MLEVKIDVLPRPDAAKKHQHASVHNSCARSQSDDAWVERWAGEGGRRHITKYRRKRNGNNTETDRNADANKWDTPFSMQLLYSYSTVARQLLNSYATLSLKLTNS